MSRLIPLLLVLGVLFGLPLAVLGLSALSSSWSFPQVFPESYDRRAIDYLVLHWHDIGIGLLSSFAYSMAAVWLTLLLCIFPARLFARAEFFGKTVLEGLFLAPALIPPMAFAMGAHYILLIVGLADTICGVVLILGLYSYPYMLRALTAGFQTYGDTLILCARNIGASSIRILLTVELPLLIPAIVAGGTIVFLVSFSEYFLVFLIGGGVVPSYSGYIFPLLNSSDKSVASLMTLLFLVVPLMLFVVVDRFVLAAYRRRGLR